MAIKTLKHLLNAHLSKIATKQIYFWPYSVKGSYLAYQKPHGEDENPPFFSK